MDALTEQQTKWAMEYAHYLRERRGTDVDDAAFHTSLLAYVADGGVGPFPESKAMEDAVRHFHAQMTGSAA
jgi:hypothetical protein